MYIYLYIYLNAITINEKKEAKYLKESREVLEGEKGMEKWRNVILL